MYFTRTPQLFACACVCVLFVADQSRGLICIGSPSAAVLACACLSSITSPAPVRAPRALLSWQEPPPGMLPVPARSARCNHIDRSDRSAQIQPHCQMSSDAAIVSSQHNHIQHLNGKILFPKKDPILLNLLALEWEKIYISKKGARSWFSFIIIQINKVTEIVTPNSDLCGHTVWSQTLDKIGRQHKWIDFERGGKRPIL